MPKDDNEYELFYWPGLPGRAEIVRLMFEVAGVPYVDVARSRGVAAVADARAGALGGLRPFAPPILRVTQDDSPPRIIAQSAVICRYLAERLDLCPPELEVEAQQLFLSWSDLVDEAHDTHHPIALGRHYEEQREPAAARAAYFTSERMPAWLGYFESVVDGNGHGIHLGKALTYVDLMAFHVLRGLAYAFPRALETVRVPKLRVLERRVGRLDRVSTYLASNRRVRFNEKGIFRRYPELDAAHAR